MSYSCERRALTSLLLGLLLLMSSCHGLLAVLGLTPRHGAMHGLVGPPNSLQRGTMSMKIRVGILGLANGMCA